VRNPFRTEAEAFSFVLVCVALFAAVAVAGIFGGGWAALGVFLALAAAVAIYVKGEPRTREPAVWERQRDGRRHILVVANETVAGRALRREIVHRAKGYDAEVLVVCPALNSPLRHWVSDEDRARAEAQARLEASLGALAEEGISARGEVGDADPLQAIEDALRVFGADEMIISTHPPGRSNWLEKDVVTIARDLYGCPIAHVVVDLAHERERPERAPAEGEP
jgi:hypothetical protein